MADDLGFIIKPDARVDQLSVSEQQKVEILKVLLGGARILIMDEPTAVLAESEAAAMLELARRLADDGRAVILITHKLRDVSATADRVTVMRAGKTVIDGAQAQGMTAAELARAMVGGETAVVRRGTAAPSAKVVLELKNLSTAGAEHDVPLREINLRLHIGEILGIAGLGGNGQSELAGDDHRLAHADGWRHHHAWLKARRFCPPRGARPGCASCPPTASISAFSAA